MTICRCCSCSATKTILQCNLCYIKDRAEENRAHLLAASRVYHITVTRVMQRDLMATRGIRRGLVVAMPGSQA